MFQGLEQKHRHSVVYRVSVGISGDAIEPFAVLQGDPGGLLGGDAAQLGELLGHVADQARVVALAPEGDGGHVGAVGFDDDAV